MDGTLSGRVAIITGSSRGIGLASARALAAEGADVVITSRSQERAAEAAATIGPHAIGMQAPADDAGQAAACIEQVLDRLGRIDILVNNAGTNPAYGPLADLSYERFSKTVSVNLWAPMMWSSQIWNRWMAEHGGVVINMASLGAFAVGPDLGGYHISKAALMHATKQLALEFAPRARVNAIAPGIVRTKLAEALWRDREPAIEAITPLGRIGEPDDIGAAVVFLASDAAAWITGHTLVVDGGQLLRASITNDVPGRDAS
jgi:NAD(P)-dependent dehydrogenase (short-subunit alcohol dehydrogenase family)